MTKKKKLEDLDRTVHTIDIEVGLMQKSMKNLLFSIDTTDAGVLDLADRVAALEGRSDTHVSHGDTALRDRIAAVQAEHQARANSCLCGWEYDPLIDDSHFDHVADAVIAELDEDYDPYEAKADAERQQWADDE